MFEHPRLAEACVTLDGVTWVTTSEDSLVRVWIKDRDASPKQTRSKDKATFEGRIR